MSLLYPAYNELVEFESVSHVSDTDQRQSFIDSCYSKIVDRLKYSAGLHVPLRYKNYYKFWWSEELSCLKDNASKSNKKYGKMQVGLDQVRLPTCATLTNVNIKGCCIVNGKRDSVTLTTYTMLL